MVALDHYHDINELVAELQKTGNHDWVEKVKEFHRAKDIADCVLTFITIWNGRRVERIIAVVLYTQTFDIYFIDIGSREITATIYFDLNSLSFRCR
jgi:hypothetical protein